VALVVNPTRARSFRQPAPEERRYVPNEVLVTLNGAVPATRLQALEQRFGLTPLAVTHLQLLDIDVLRYRIADNNSVRGMIAALSNEADIRAAQPNYLFQLQGETSQGQVAPAGAPNAAAPPDASGAGASPDPSANGAQADPSAAGAATDPSGAGAPQVPHLQQYAIDTMELDSAHKLATGQGVLIAVIDTGLDETHPEIAGRIADRFDAIGGIFHPHSHGTAMGGVIVAHRDLVGIAPDAQLLAIRAFDTMGAGGGEGTSFDIVRGIDFAASRHAQILNMSFAGPRDDILSDALAKARILGMIEIAAAGNGGPDAEPMFPGAEPGVVAVTATDTHNRIFIMANRGAYVALAAPGVDIIAPSVDGTVQLTSGTSVAAAEASGVAALLLQAHPGLGSADLRHLLSQTALPLADENGQPGELINARAALDALSTPVVAH
jgi:subtilisin family serine protease